MFARVWLLAILVKDAIVVTGATGASEALQRVMEGVASFEDDGRGEIDAERGSWPSRISDAL